MAALAICAALVPFLLRRRAASAQAAPAKTFNILVIGTDAPTEGTGEIRADVLVLAVCDPAGNGLKALSIPRDTLVEFPGAGEDRINNAYTKGGAGLTRTLVSGLTGLTVDRHVVVDFRGFEELIDLLGGVEVEVDKRMYYQDKKQGLLIDLQKGRQRLNGSQALGFIRYRRDAMGDLARVERQQQVIGAMLRQAAKVKPWTKAIPLYRWWRQYIQTDLGLLDLYRLYKMRNLVLAAGKKLRTYTVPGWFSGPYWRADAEALAALVGREFRAGARDSGNKGEKE